MKVWQDGDGLLVVGKRRRVVHEDVYQLLHVRRQVAVGQHRAFRDPGSAAGVLKRRHVLDWVDIHLRRGVRIQLQKSPEAVVRGIYALRLASKVDDDYVPDARLRQDRLRPRVDVGVDDERLGAGVLEDVLDLPLHVHRV